MAGADMSANDVSNTWTLIASEGEMKVYKKEMNDAKGDTVYTLKAVHTVTVIMILLMWIIFDYIKSGCRLY